MAKHDEAAVTTVRNVELGDWGKVLIEEVLFRAARDISEKAIPIGDVTVSIEFRLAPDEKSRTIEISIPGAVEPRIRTRLPIDA